MFTVVVTEKGGSQQRLEFDEERITIGRVQGNHVVLPRGNVSKRHSQINIKNNLFVVSDAGSTNGTYVNGRRIHEPTRVYGGDKVYIGDFILGLEDNEGLVKSSDATETDVLKRSALTDKKNKPAADDGAMAGKADASMEGLMESTLQGHQVKANGDKPRVSAPVRERVIQSASEAAKDSLSKLPRPSNGSGLPDLGAKKSIPKPPGKKSPASPGGKAAVGDKDLIKEPNDYDGLVDRLLDLVAKQVKRFNRVNAPTRMDGGTAGTVRIVADQLVTEYVQRGKLPPSVDPNVLRGRIFRAAVDMGPLSAWMDDDEVEALRILAPDVVYLLKGGNWSEASSGFLSAEDLSEILECLSAGLEVCEAGAPGMTRYRLEEGHMVFSAVSPGATSGSSVVIDKTYSHAGRAGRIQIIDRKIEPILSEAMNRRANIAVLGDIGPTRLEVVGELSKGTGEGRFKVVIEDLPMVQAVDRNELRLSVRGRKIEETVESRLGALLFHALDMGPDWLVISGTNWSDVSHVFAVAAGRSGVIAELPLGAVKLSVDEELAIGLTTSRSTATSNSAAKMLAGAFDYIVIVGRESGKTSFVNRILESRISDDGQWDPRILFERAGK